MTKTDALKNLSEAMQQKLTGDNLISIKFDLSQAFDSSALTSHAFLLTTVFLVD